MLADSFDNVRIRSFSTWIRYEFRTELMPLRLVRIFTLQRFSDISLFFLHPHYPRLSLWTRWKTLRMRQISRVFPLKQEAWISVFRYLQHSRRKHIRERKNFLEKYCQYCYQIHGTLLLRKLAIVILIKLPSSIRSNFFFSPPNQSPNRWIAEKGR